VLDAGALPVSKKIYGFPDFLRTVFFNLLNTLFAFLVERLQREVSVFLLVGESYISLHRENERQVGVGWWIQSPAGSGVCRRFHFGTT